MAADVLLAVDPLRSWIPSSVPSELGCTRAISCTDTRESRRCQDADDIVRIQGEGRAGESGHKNWPSVMEVVGHAAPRLASTAESFSSHFSRMYRSKSVLM